MKPLPDPETYNEGLDYWPYKTSLEAVLTYLSKNAPLGDSVLDIMCGPGWLIDKIHERRPDLSITGMDIDERYVDFAQRACPYARIVHGDILQWKSAPFDVVVCTGSLHHITYEQQETAIVNIKSLLVPGGFAVISDCYVDDYSTEIERKLVAARLGFEYLRTTIVNGAPDKVVGWTADILHNDVLRNECKTSLAKRRPLLQKHFSRGSTAKTWPMDTSEGYGDYVHICSAA